MCSAAAWSWLSPVPTARTWAALHRSSSRARRISSVTLSSTAGGGAVDERVGGGAGGGPHLLDGDAGLAGQAAAVLELGARAQHLAVERADLHAYLPEGGLDALEGAPQHGAAEAVHAH